MPCTRGDAHGRNIAIPPVAATRLIPIVFAGAILALTWVKIPAGSRVPPDTAVAALTRHPLSDPT